MVLDAALHSAAHADIVQNPEPHALFLPSKLRQFTFYQALKAGERVFSHLKLRDWTPG